MCFRASILNTFLYLSFWVSRWEGKKKIILVGRVQCGHENCAISNTSQSRVFGEADLDRIHLPSSEFGQVSLRSSNMFSDRCHSVVCSSVHSCFLREGEMDYSPSREPVGSLNNNKKKPILPDVHQLMLVTNRPIQLLASKTRQFTLEIRQKGNVTF